MRLGLVLMWAALSAVTLVGSQSSETTKVVAEVRAALGGDAPLAAVRSLTFDGTLTPMRADGSAGEAAPVSIAVELPDKYVRRDHLGNLNGTPIARSLGFNSATPIEIMDVPRSGELQRGADGRTIRRAAARSRAAGTRGGGEAAGRRVSAVLGRPHAVRRPEATHTAPADDRRAGH